MTDRADRIRQIVEAAMREGKSPDQALEAVFSELGDGTPAGTASLGEEVERVLEYGKLDYNAQAQAALFLGRFSEPMSGRTGEGEADPEELDDEDYRAAMRSCLEETAAELDVSPEIAREIVTREFGADWEGYGREE